MTDNLATLGIKVDATQVKDATAALSGLAAAAKPAATAAANLTKATDDQAHAHAGLSGQAQAAGHSIRSMIEALASGMPISQTLTQQFGHLSYAASGEGGLTGAFKSAGGALLGLLNPVTAVITVVAAVAAGSVYAVSSVSRMAQAFDDTSRQAGITTDKLHGLQQAAAFKGIDSADFLKPMDKFAGSVDDAQHGMGNLVGTFRANNVQAKSFTDYLSTAADLIKNANTDQQRLKLLQEMGLPATMQWVRYLSQGADGIRKAADEAVKFDQSAEGQMIAKARQFDEAWDKSWSNFSNGIKSAVINGASWLDKAIDKAGDLMTRLNRGMVGAPEANPSGLVTRGEDLAAPKTEAKVETLAERQKKISDQQTYIGLLGQTATSADAVRQVQLAADAAYLSTGVAVSKARLQSLKDIAREQSNGVSAIKASTDAQLIEAQTVGMSVQQATEYAAVQNAINRAKQERRTLSDSDLASIRSESSALGQAAANADLLKFAYSGLVQGPMQTFQQAIANGATAMDALKKAGVSALNSLSSKLMDMAAQNLWKNAFGGSSGGGLMSLLGLGGDTSGSVTSSGAISGAVGGTSVGGAALTFADGGYTGPGGKNEPAGIVHKGEYVMDAATTARIGVANLNRMRGYADGGLVDGSKVTAPTSDGTSRTSNSISAPVTINIDATGADAAGLARVQTQLAQLKAELPARVVAAVTTAQKQRQL